MIDIFTYVLYVLYVCMFVHIWLEEYKCMCVCMYVGVHCHERVLLLGAEVRPRHMPRRGDDRLQLGREIHIQIGEELHSDL